MRRAALLIAVALTAACGSTVQQAGVGTTESRVAGDDDELGTGSVDTAGVGSEVTTEDGVAGPITTAPRRTSANPSAAARAEAAAGTRGGRVRIGVRYPDNSGGLITLAGFAGVNPGDSRAIAAAIIEDVNARGGIAGRRVDPLYVPFDVTASVAPGGSDAEQQKACSAFTEDNSVFAVVSPIVSGEILERCLAQRGVVFADENWNYFDPHAVGPGYWTPAYPDPVRSFGALVDRLVATGFLGTGAKVGAVYQDLPNRKRPLDAGLRPALARHGLKVDATVAWSGRDSSQLAAGVLRFRTEGITHVFILDPGGLETFGWMTEAEGQSWRPKYALDTRNYPSLQQGQSPRNQLLNARGIGWVPSADVGVQPDAELSAPDRRCLGVAAKSGQSFTEATNVRVALAYCDTLEFLKAAAGDGAVELTLASVRVGGEALGERFTPTGTFRARFGPGRHDGAAALRDLVFDGGCSCFRYSGPVLPMG